MNKRETEDNISFQEVNLIEKLTDMVKKESIIHSFFDTTEIKILISPLSRDEQLNSSSGEGASKRKNYKINNVILDSKVGENASDIIYQLAEKTTKELSTILKFQGSSDEILKVLDDSKNTKDQIKFKVREIVDRERLTTSTFNWSVFYLLKELFQKLSNKEKIKNYDVYFRGQSHNWEVVPGVIRPGIKIEYAEKFDEIYHSLAFEFEGIDYIPLSKNMTVGEQEQRAKNIALLQHFGLLTPYVDITTNEYVSLFFMVDVPEIDSPIIDLFFDSNQHNQKSVSLVQKAPRSDANVRLSAQKGLFLNFEKTIVEEVIRKLKRIRISIEFDIDCYLSNISESDFFDETDVEIINELVGDKPKFKYFSSWEDKLQRALEDQKLEIKELLQSKEASMEEKIQSMIRSEKLKEMKKKFKQINSELFRHIQLEIQKKLSEYKYTSEEIYPDLARRLQSIKNQNTSNEFELHSNMDILSYKEENIK